MVKRRKPPWALPLAVLQCECLVSVGTWCCVTFLIHAIEPRATEPQGQKPKRNTTLTTTTASRLPLTHNDDVGIIGIGVHQFGRHPGASGLEMAVAAVRSALQY